MISSLIHVYTAQCKCMIVETHASANTVCTHVVLYTWFPCKCYHTKMYTVHVTYCMQQFTLVVGTVSHTSTFSIDSTWRGHTWGDIKHYKCRDIQSYIQWHVYRLRPSAPTRLKHTVHLHTWNTPRFQFVVAMATERDCWWPPDSSPVYTLEAHHIFCSVTSGCGRGSCNGSKTWFEVQWAIHVAMTQGGWL